MRNMRSARPTSPLLLLTIAAVVLWAGTVSARAAAGLKGRWHVDTSIKCISNGYNLAACQRIAGSQFAAFSVQRAILALHSSSEYLVDSHGRFTGHGSTT